MTLFFLKIARCLLNPPKNKQKSGKMTSLFEIFSFPGRKVLQKWLKNQFHEVMIWFFNCFLSFHLQRLTDMISELNCFLFAFKGHMEVILLECFFEKTSSKSSLFPGSQVHAFEEEESVSRWELHCSIKIESCRKKVKEKKFFARRKFEKTFQVWNICILLICFQEALSNSHSFFWIALILLHPKEGKESVKGENINVLENACELSIEIDSCKKINVISLACFQETLSKFQFFWIKFMLQEKNSREEESVSRWELRCHMNIWESSIYENWV